MSAALESTEEKYHSHKELKTHRERINPVYKLFFFHLNENLSLFITIPYSQRSKPRREVTDMTECNTQAMLFSNANRKVYIQ